MGPAMPNRRTVAALLDRFNAANRALTDWQTRVQAATNGLFTNAKQQHDRAVAAALATAPVPNLVASASKPINAALTSAGITTVAELAKALVGTTSVAGLSRATTAHLRDWCATQTAAIAKATPLTIDFAAIPATSLAIVRTAIAWPALTKAGTALDQLRTGQAQTLATLIAGISLRRLTKVGWWLTGHAQRQQLVAAVTALATGVPAFEAAVTAAVAELSQAQPLSDDAVMARFNADAASFYALFEHLGLAGMAPTALAMDPFTSPAEAPASLAAEDEISRLLAKVAAIDYTNPLLTAQLRGWQAFGVRYALAQQRVLIGDEMGLGKTLEALGVITARLHAGATHALVVAPIGTLTNWRREVAKHTTLVPYLLRGEHKTTQLAEWQAKGGIAFINYEQVWRLPHLAHLDVLVADEAQALLNPDSKRTGAGTTLAQQAPTVMYMTGTPIQNSLQDMVTLIQPLQPAICDRLTHGPQLLADVAFKRLVAPVYLRRNRAAVLKELPPLSRQDVWVGASALERQAYRAAVAAGDFMAMRQASWQTGEAVAASPKRAWLSNLVTEALANGRKVLIFSYFRRALTQLTLDLGAKLLPVVTGDMPLAERQAVVDEFQLASGGAVLAAQITTLGQGVNLQAADTIVFCEPQLNPATEEQAISRAYRMGQTRPVTVYRLLMTSSVDQLLVARGAQKLAVFAKYAKPSAVAEATPDATAGTTSALLTQLVGSERKRLASRDDDWDVY